MGDPFRPRVSEAGRGRVCGAAICDVLLRGFLQENEGPDPLTPNAVELIPTLGALFPRGGPGQEPVLTVGSE